MPTVVFVLGNEPIKIDTKNKNLTVGEALEEAGIETGRGTKIKGTEDGTNYIVLTKSDKIIKYKELLVMGKVSGS